MIIINLQFTIYKNYKSQTNHYIHLKRKKKLHQRIFIYI